MTQRLRLSDVIKRRDSQRGPRSPFIVNFSPRCTWKSTVPSRTYSGPANTKRNGKQMRLVEISMRVFTWEAFRRCRFNRGNQRMRKRVPLHRAASTETSDCFSRLFTGMKFSLENRGELAPVQMVSYRRLENHTREPNRTRHRRTVAPRYHKYLLCHLLFFLDIFESFTYPSGMKCFCGCLFLTQSQGLAFLVFWGLFVALLCAIEVFSLGTTFPEYLPSKNRFIIYSIECYLVKDFLI